MNRVTKKLALLPLVGLVFLPGCGGGGGSDTVIIIPNPFIVIEVEPNDDPVDATLLPDNAVGKGDVIVAGDVDFWEFSALAGELFRIELYATRCDQLNWDANVNSPRLTLFAPNGTFVIIDHDFFGTDVAGWIYASHDLDFPIFQADATGLFKIRIGQDDPTGPGGEYAIRVVPLVVPALQFEAEIPGTSGANDTAATAEQLLVDDLRGFHVDGESDFYAITLATPTVLDVEITTYRNGGHIGDNSYFSPRLDLFDIDGVTLLASNDATFYSDSTIRFLIAFPGTYFVRVGQCCDTGDGDYFLSLRQSVLVTADAELEPNDDAANATFAPFETTISGTVTVGDDDFYAIDGLAGDLVVVFQYDLLNRQDSTDVVTVEFLAVDGVSLLSQDSFGTLGANRTILQEDGFHFVRVRSTGPPTPYTLQFELFAESQYETEPNDTSMSATSINQLRVGAGTIDNPGDVDFFRFGAVEDDLVIVSIFASPSPGSDGFSSLSGYGSLMVPRIRVFDPNGVLVAESTATPPNGVFAEGITDGLPTLAAAVTTTESGQYRVEVTDALGGGSIDHYYLVEVR